MSLFTNKAWPLTKLINKSPWIEIWAFLTLIELRYVSLLIKCYPCNKILVLISFGLTNILSPNDLYWLLDYWECGLLNIVVISSMWYGSDFFFLPLSYPSALLNLKFIKRLITIIDIRQYLPKQPHLLTSVDMNTHKMLCLRIGLSILWKYKYLFILVY